MAPARWQVDQLIEDVALLGRNGLPREEYYREVTPQGIPRSCWKTMASGYSASATCSTISCS
jgi:hypothetical protein